MDVFCTTSSTKNSKKLNLSGFLLVSILFSSVTSQTLVFEDDFNTFNLGVWSHMITGWRGGNNEFQYYTNRTENSYVENGTLFLQPTLTSNRFNTSFLYNGTLDLSKEGCNFNTGNDCIIKPGVDIINPIQSARIYTSKSFSLLYGTVEVRAKMPRGDWIWPAIWMMPTNSVYGGWPTSGEMDIAELRGNTNLTCPWQGNIGITRTYSALHWGPSPSTNQFQKTVWGKSLSNGSFSSDFHVYRLEWTLNNITFKVDGQVVGSITPPDGGFWQLSGLNGTNPWSSGTKMAPFDQKFYIIMNVAVGGNFFPDGCTNVPFQKPWNNSSPTMMRDFWQKKCQWYPTWSSSSQERSAMQVDYIRVWSL